MTRHFFFSPEDPASAKFSTWGGLEQLGDRGLVHVLGRDQRLPGRDLGRYLLLLEVIDQRPHSERTHLVGILDHKALKLPLLQRIDQRLAGVEPDEDHALSRRRAGGTTGFGPAHRQSPTIARQQNEDGNSRADRRDMRNDLLKSYRLSKSRLILRRPERPRQARPPHGASTEETSQGDLTSADPVVSIPLVPS